MPFGAALAAAAPAIIGAVAPAVIGVAAGALSGGAASGAVSAGAAKAGGIDQASLDLAKSNMQADRANAQPYVTQGQGATNRLSDLFGLNGQPAADTAMQGFQASPGYGYQVDQGLKAVDNGAASIGLLRSGATIRAEQTLGSNLANQDYGNYVNRLMGVANMGLQGASLDNQSTNTFSGLLNGLTQDQTKTIASAAGQNASIYSGTINGIGNAAGGILRSDEGKSALSSLFGSGGGSGLGSAGTYSFSAGGMV